MVLSRVVNLNLQQIIYVMLQLEKEFLNNYFSKLKINPVIEIQGRRFRKCQKENVIPQNRK